MTEQQANELAEDIRPMVAERAPLAQVRVYSAAGVVGRGADGFSAYRMQYWVTVRAGQMWEEFHSRHDWTLRGGEVLMILGAATRDWVPAQEAMR